MEKGPGGSKMPETWVRLPTSKIANAACVDRHAAMRSSRGLGHRPCIKKEQRMIATREQALALAVQLWGPKVTVCDRGILPGYGRFTINSGTWACNDGKDKVNIWGSGRSW